MNEQAVFHLATAIVQGAVEMPRGTQEERLNTIQINREFANSKFLRIYCDCTDNFEFNKLSKIIKEKNNKMERMILEGIPDEIEKRFSNRYNI